MSAKFRIEGSGGGLTASVTQDERHSPGLVAYTHALDDYDFALVPLSNPDYGINMAVDPTAVVSTLTLVHNGTDNVGWTGADVNGNGFIFDSTDEAFDGTRSIDATGSSNNDVAGFTAPAPVNPTAFTALSFRIFITKFDSKDDKDVTMQLFNGGAAVGQEISIKPYINTQTEDVWLLGVIPITDFSLAGVSQFDELRVKTIDTGKGAAPNYYLDAINFVLASAGSGVASYRFEPDFGEDYSLLTLRITAYNTSKAAANPTEFFGLPALDGGFELVLRNKRRVFLSLIALDLWDLLRAPNAEVRTNADGGTGATFIVDFTIPIEHLMINGSEGTFIEVRVKDNLTGLDRLETSLHLAKLR